MTLGLLRITDHCSLITDHLWLHEEDPRRI